MWYRYTRQNHYKIAAKLFYLIFFRQKVEVLQYNTCLAITGVIRDTLKEKPYEELSLGCLAPRRWYRKLSCFYKFYKNKYPQYLFKFCEEARSSGCITGSMSNIAFFENRPYLFQKLFLLIESGIIFRNPSSFNIFRNMKFIRSFADGFITAVILKVLNLLQDFGLV